MDTKTNSGGGWWNTSRGAGGRGRGGRETGGGGAWRGGRGGTETGGGGAWRGGRGGTETGGGGAWGGGRGGGETGGGGAWRGGRGGTETGGGGTWRGGRGRGGGETGGGPWRGGRGGTETGGGGAWRGGRGRGGGCFNPPRGGGRGGAEAAGGSQIDAAEHFRLESRPAPSSSDDTNGRLQEESNASSNSIALTNEYEEQLKEFLQDLQRGEFDDSDEESHFDSSKEQREEGQFWATNDMPASETANDSHVSQRKLARPNPSFANVVLENGKLCGEFHSKLSSRRYMSLLEQRKNLPAWTEEDHILDLLDQNQVLVVSGMTGCGKTTQIPQFILDASLRGPAGQVANIVCTQPRRISATSVAQRVAQERAEALGHSVGYQIRLEAVRTSATRLLYCTTGVLLRRLQGEPDLKGVTHIIVDEVHERTDESDFLLLVLKDLSVQRPELKIILMSATLNADLFSKYFNNCPTIHIPGQTFPVDQFFLEDVISKTRYVIDDSSPYVRKHSFKSRPWKAIDDLVQDSLPDQDLNLQQLSIRYKDVRMPVLETLAEMDLDEINMDLVERLLEWIVDGEHEYPPGAVLVFMPGLAEIKMLYDQLQSNKIFQNESRCVVYPLHSTLSNEDQQAIFGHPPEGVTKIIISTNIAETSVTIDDVVYVIDSGKMKEKRYDASRSMESLEDSWVSRANALQRKGRAGRVASGVCFHLFTSNCFQHQLAEQQLPEIQRVPLEQLCLRIKSLDVFADQTLESVFSRLIESPFLGNLNAAIQRLQDVGALTVDEKLTPLGRHLACLPVDVSIGKLMLFGAIFHCLDPALTIAASLASKLPFVCPWEKRKEANEKKLAFAVDNSDHLALLQAYKGWCSAAMNGKKAAYFYCRENFLSERVLKEIASLKRQFAELLSDIGFCRKGLRARAIERASRWGTDGVLEATGPEANVNSENIRLMSAMLCAALYPNVLQVQAPHGNKAKDLHFMTKSDGYVHIHPSSVNYPTCHYESSYLVYREKVKTSRVFVRDCSMVSMYPLVLFGGREINVKVNKGKFFVYLDDGWIKFPAASYQVANLVKELRWELDQLLEDKITNPSIDLNKCPHRSSIIQMIVRLITTHARSCVTLS